MRRSFDSVPSLSFVNNIRVATACGLAWVLIVVVAVRAIGQDHDLWLLTWVGGAAISLFLASRAALRASGLRFVTRAEASARLEPERCRVGALAMCAYPSLWFGALMLGVSKVVQQLRPDWPHLWSNPTNYMLFVFMLVTTTLRHRALQRAALRASQPRVEPRLG